MALIDSTDKLIKFPIPSYRRGAVFMGRYLICHNAIVDLESLNILFCEEQVQAKKTIYDSREYLFLTIGNRTYFLNEKGEIISNDSTKKSIKSAMDGYYAIEVSSATSQKDDKNSKYGIINSALEWLIPPVYQDCKIISAEHGYFRVIGENGLAGIIDKKGKLILPMDYGFIDLRGNHFYAFEHRPYQHPNLVTIYTLAGEIHKEISLDHDNIRFKHFIGDQVIFSGVNRKTGQNAMLDGYFEETFAADNLRIEHKFGPSGLLLREGKRRPFEYFVVDLKGNPYPFKVNDQLYTEVILPNMGITDKFTFLKLSDKGPAYVYDLISNEAYLIDSDIDYFSVLYSAKYGILQSRKNNHYGLINTSGEEIVPPLFGSLTGGSNNNHIQVNTDKHTYLISWKGDIFFPEYDNTSIGLYHHLKVSKGGLTGIVNQRNEIIIPIEYLSIDIDNQNKVYQAVNNQGEKITFGIDGGILK